MTEKMAKVLREVLAKSPPESATRHTRRASIRENLPLIERAIPAGWTWAQLAAEFQRVGIPLLGDTLRSTVAELQRQRTLEAPASATQPSQNHSQPMTRKPQTRGEKASTVSVAKDLEPATRAFKGLAPGVTEKRPIGSSSKSTEFNAAPPQSVVSESPKVPAIGSPESSADSDGNSARTARAAHADLALKTPKARLQLQSEFDLDE